jgi:phosphatidylglycerol lysyltransferase
VAEGVRMLGLVRRYGWNATSFQLVESEFRKWFVREGDGAVAFIDTGDALVVAGPPVAAEERLGTVALRFVSDARRNGRRVAFFGVEERFLRSIGMRSMQIGLQPRWNPQNWKPHRSLREQLRRARAKGVAVERVPSSEIVAHRDAIERLITRWLSSRPMPAMSFLVELSPFAFAEERRYYAARANRRLLGLLVAVPIYQRDGWFFQDVLRDPEAPNGTAESLIHAAMLDVAADGATFMTLGLAPLAGDLRWQRLMRRAMAGFYNFDGLHAFKSKLRPEGWDPVYLAWPRGNGAIAVLDVLTAFAGGSLVWFGVRAFLRAPAPVLLILGVLAVPWAALLAVIDTEQWFPSRFVQYAWVVFDLVMAGVLISLSRRWRPRLGAAAAIATSLDAVITTIEAIAYNRKRMRSGRDRVIVAIALTAPILVSAILIGRLLKK